MTFGQINKEEKQFADLVLKELRDSNFAGGTASHVITMNVYDNGRMVYKGFDVVPRKYNDPKIVEADDIKTVILRIGQEIVPTEYSPHERELLLGQHDEELESGLKEDLPPSGGEGVVEEDAKSRFFGSSASS